MAIRPNFGQIQPIALPPVQSVPVTQSLPARSGGDGSGADFNAIGSAFQELGRDQRAQESHDLQMKQGEQDLAFNAEMNPLKLQQGQQAVEAGGIAVEKARAEWEQQKEGQNVIYQAVQNGEDPTKAYEGYLKNTSPDKYNSYREKAADTEKAIASVAKVQAETKQAQIETEKMLRQELAANAIAIRSMGPKEMQEEMWKKMLPEIRKIHPTAPAKYDPKLLDYWTAQGAADYVPQSPEGKLAKDVTMLGGDGKDTINKISEAKLKGEKAKLDKELNSSVDDLRKEHTENSKTEVEIQQKAQSIMGLYKSNSPVATAGMITSTVRMFEKGVLTDADYSRYATAAGLNQKVAAQIRNWKEGQPVTEEMRANVLAVGMAANEDNNNRIRQRNKVYEDLAERRGLKKEDVTMNLKTYDPSFVSEHPTLKGQKITWSQIQEVSKATKKTPGQVITQLGIQAE